MPEFLTPSVFILFRVVGAVILFWTVKTIFVRERVEKADLLRIAACGLFGVAINQMCFFHGLSLSSSINAGIIMTVNPIIVVLLSYLILKEKITGFKFTGIVIGAIGAIFLTLTAGTGSGDSVFGDFLLFINAASYGLYLVLVKPLMQKYAPVTVITYIFTFGLLYILLYPPTLSEFFSIDYSLLTQAVIFKITYIIVGVTFLAYLLTVYALKDLSPSVSSSYIYLQPVLVILFAVTFAAVGIAEDYTDTITWEKIGYMLIIFVGVFITTRRKSLKN